MISKDLPARAPRGSPKNTGIRAQAAQVGLGLISNGDQNADALEETFQAVVLDAAEVAPSRKSDGNAVPALVVSGPGLGRIKWVQPVHNGTHAHDPAGQEQASRVAKEEEHEKTPEEKRKPYDKRRRQVVIEAVKSKLAALAAESDLDQAAAVEGGRALAAKGLTVKTLVLLAAMIGERGWRGQVHDGELAMPHGFSWSALDALKNHETGPGQTREAVLRLCWDLMRMTVGKLAARLSVAPGEFNNQAHYDEAEALCAMLGFDLASLRAEAAAAIPYAKLWREEIVDDWAAPGAQAEPEPEEAVAGGSESQ